MPEGRQSITVRDVMAMIGRSKASANRLLIALEARGLKRKGRGRGTHYRKDEFLAAWAAWDTRE